MIFISWRYGLRACTVGRYLGYSKILSVVDPGLPPTPNEATAETLKKA